MSETDLVLQKKYRGNDVEARWTLVQAKAKQPEIGKVLDDAMIAI